MQIEGAIWLRSVVEKLAVKHHVETHEVEEVLAGTPQIRFMEKVSGQAKMFMPRWGKRRPGVT
jgi:hypothetical protein